LNRSRKRTCSAQTALWDFTPDPVWQKRFYDFNVWSARKQIEKLRYMHRNPVKRGLADRPEQWRWSSFRAYAYGETGRVRVKCQEWALEVKRRAVEKFGAGGYALGQANCRSLAPLGMTIKKRMTIKNVSSVFGSYGRPDSAA
jgi:hypothetical protein